MTNEDLKAWLLLAGFSYSSKENTYFRYVDKSFHDYAIVHFLVGGDIAIGTRQTHTLYSNLFRVQRHIRELLGDRHADIPPV